MAVNDLKRHLGIDVGRTLVYVLVQQLALPEDGTGALPESIRRSIRLSRHC
jgi:hypothetical protein